MIFLSGWVVSSNSEPGKPTLPFLSCFCWHFVTRKYNVSSELEETSWPSTGLVTPHPPYSTPFQVQTLSVQVSEASQTRLASPTSLGHFYLCLELSQEPRLTLCQNSPIALPVELATPFSLPGSVS